MTERSRSARALYSWSIVPALIVSAAAGGCGEDLGSCDRAAAEELVYSDDGMVATKGQALLHDSCGQGAYCHSAAAAGEDRRGAPPELSLDMLPTPSGWSQLIEQRDEVWAKVLDGHMAASDDSSYTQRRWVFDQRRRSSAPVLPALDSSDGKGALRNWLACGAPLVARTEFPQWLEGALCDSSGDEAFDALYNAVLRPRCAQSCHDLSAPGGLNMVDACRAYEALLQEGACGVRLRPGDETSPLLDQIDSRAPRCGLAMPPHEMLSSDEIAAVRDYIKAAARPEETPEQSSY